MQANSLHEVLEGRVGSEGIQERSDEELAHECVPVLIGSLQQREGFFLLSKLGERNPGKARRTRREHTDIAARSRRSPRSRREASLRRARFERTGRPRGSGSRRELLEQPRLEAFSSLPHSKCLNGPSNARFACVQLP